MKLFLIVVFALLALVVAYPHFGVVEKVVFRVFIPSMNIFQRENEHKPHANSSESSSSSESTESYETTTQDSVRVLPESVSEPVIIVEVSTVEPEEGSGEEEILVFPALPILLP